MRRVEDNAPYPCYARGQRARGRIDYDDDDEEEDEEVNGREGADRLRGRRRRRRRGRESRWIEDDVFDSHAVPGVGDVDEAIAGLDHRRIGVFTGRVFE